MCAIISSIWSVTKSYNDVIKKPISMKIHPSITVFLGLLLLSLSVCVYRLNHLWEPSHPSSSETTETVLYHSVQLVIFALFSGKFLVPSAYYSHIQ